MALTRKFFGGTVSEGAAFAFGAATAPVLAPGLETIRQAAWNLHAVRIPEAAELAAGVAQGKVDAGDAAAWAQSHGFKDDPWKALIALARTAPDVGLAMQAWRRGKLSPAEFATVLKRHGIADEWNAAIEALKDAILSPGELAASIHRGLIPDPGLLKGEQPQGPFKVEAYPVYAIDALHEALGSGFDHDRLGVLVGLQGLPMGTHEAAESTFRKIITHGDYIRAFNESNSRNEWAAAVLEHARQIPTARDFLENSLRGYRDLDAAIAGAALHGMSAEHATLIYQNQGRPMNVHQITQALARGAKFHPEPGEITDPYLASTVEGPIKPAYYEMNQALKYVVPGVFAIRALTESGVWDEAKAAERLKWSGWFPADADEVAHAWASGGGTAADPHVAKAQTQLWTTTHASYKAREIAAGTATAALEKAGVTAAAVPTVLDIWNAERDLIRARLQASDVRKAYRKQDENPRTGAAWSRADAVAELLELGWSNEDAEAYLNIG